MTRRLLLSLAALACGCAQNTGVADLDAPLGPTGPLERAPYLVQVTDSTAVVRWRTSSSMAPGFRWWVAGDTTTVELDSGRDHTVVLRGFEPDAEIGYEVGLTDTLWTEPTVFRASPEAGSKEPFTFLVVGDTGTLSSGQLAIARHVNDEEAALILHCGDVAYPDGTERELTEKHFAVYAPILRRAPLYPVPGDHDVRVRLGEPYLDAFDPPGGRASGSPFYYAFTHGNVRFVALDTKTDAEGYLGDPTSPQRRWLQQELASARSDPGIDWTVVFFHHAPYSASTGFGGHGSDVTVRAALAPVFDEYGVQLVFSGHDHDYQRSRPLHDNTIVPDGEGTVYIVTGGGGGRRTFRGTGADWFTAYSEQAYEYVRATVDHYTLRIEAIDVDGRVFDEVELEIPEALRKSVPEPEARKPILVETEPMPMPASGAGSATGAQPVQPR